MNELIGTTVVLGVFFYFLTLSVLAVIEGRGSTASSEKDWTPMENND